MSKNKADLWTIPMSDFGFYNLCVWDVNIEKVSIRNGGNDGWNFASIMTILHAPYNDTYIVLTADMNANSWVDGDGTADQLQFDLTLV